MIVVGQDLYHRLVFLLNLPKIEILRVATVPEGEAFDIEAVRAIAQRIANMREECRECVDELCTGIWLHRLLHMGDLVCRKAHEALRGCLSVLRVTSSLAEKKHLLGQELKAPKRGGGISCYGLGERVFIRLFAHASEVLRSESMSSALGRDPTLRRYFMQSLAEVQIGGHRDRRCSSSLDKSNAALIKSALADVTKASRRKRAYDLFVSSQYHSGLVASSGHPFAKRKVLDEKWKLLSDAERHAYQVQADEDNKDAERHKKRKLPSLFEKERRRKPESSHEETKKVSWRTGQSYDSDDARDDEP